jgi:hypothetical protein
MKWWLFLGLWSWGAEAGTRVFSRSIMDSCEYVYRVESDLRIYPSVELFEVFAGAPIYVRASFANAWDRGPLRSKTYLIPVGDRGFAEFSFESMSQSAGHLYRDMTFDWGVLDANGTFFELSDDYYSDVGRDFGQSCRTRRGQDSEFKNRQVTRDLRTAL